MFEEEIAHGESDILEFKREFPSKDKKVMKTVVAFANCRGGRIIFGVENQTCEIRGVPEDDRARLQDLVTDMISDTCVPQVFPSFSWLTHEGKALFVVDVPISGQTPYYIKAEGMEQGVYVRVGATTRRASPEKVRELQLRGQNLTYDAVVESGILPVSRKSTEKVCADIREYMESTAKPVGVNQLISWGLLRREGHALYPSNAYRLLVGEGLHFSGVQCAVFQGVDKVDFLDRKEFGGSLMEQLENAQRFLMQYLRQSSVIKGIRRDDICEIPLEALREVIANAILHRNYLVHAYIQVAIFDDRIEISSPGGLYDNLTKEEMLSGISRLRNPLLADLFLKMGIVEQWGTGIKRVIRACTQVGLEIPEYIVTGDSVKVIIRRPGRQAQVTPRKKHRRRPHKRDEALLAYLKEHPHAPLQQAADAFFISVATVWRFVQDMRATGKL